MASSTSVEAIVLNPKFSAKTRTLLKSSEKTTAQVHQSKLALRRGELVGEIQAINRSHNSVTWTCRLPRETLLRIFLLVRLQTLDSHKSKQRLSWLRTTHVCSHWRSVALASTNLWSILDFGHPTVTRMMLERSQSSVLDVEFDKDNYADSLIELSVAAMAEVLITQVERLRSVKIDLSGMAQELVSSILSILSVWITPATRLEYLSITASPALSRIPSNSKTIEVARFVPNGSAPSLQHLSLIGCSIPFDALSFSQNVTFLCLGNTAESEGGLRAGSMLSLVLALQKMPHLQDLSMTNYLPAATTTGDDPTSTAPPHSLAMPSLTRLKIYDTHTNSISRFLNVIRCPNLSSVGVNTILGRADPRHYPPFIELHNMLHSTSQESNKAFRTADYMQLCLLNDSLSCKLWFCLEESHDGSHGRPCNAPGLEVKFEGDTSTAAAGLEAVIKYFDLSSVQTVDLLFQHEAEGVCELISRLPHVKTIELDRPGTDVVMNFVKVWNLPAERNQFPALSALILDDVPPIVVPELVSAFRARRGGMSKMKLRTWTGSKFRIFDYKGKIEEVPGVEITCEKVPRLG